MNMPHGRPCSSWATNMSGRLSRHADQFSTMNVRKQERTGEIEDEDKAIQGHQANDRCPPISHPVRQGSSNTNADECSKLAGHLQKEKIQSVSSRY